MDYGNLKRCWRLGDGYTLADGMKLGHQVGRWREFAYRSAAQERDIMPVATSSIEKVRHPTYSLFIEEVGDVTAYMKELTFRRGIKDSLHEPIPGKGSAVLVDTDGVFIDNGQCTIRPGSIIRMWAGFYEDSIQEGDNVPRFKGEVIEPKISSATGKIELLLGGMGWQLKRSHTSGDYSDYNTPKLLIDELIASEFLGTVSYENETGEPTTYEFGNTTLNRRSKWAIIHGATLSIGYIFYFDHSGQLQCKRRESFNDINVLLDDSNIISIEHVSMAEFYNKKSIGHAGENPTWAFTLGDNVRWGQTTYTKTDRLSRALYGEESEISKFKGDYEDDELIAGWSNAYSNINTGLEWFPYPRHVYAVEIPALPQVNMMDRLTVLSDERDIKGKMSVIGIEERIRAGYYYNVLTLLSEAERF